VKLIFSLIGLISFFFILKKYGLKNTFTELKQPAPLLLLLIFTFIPTLVCYSVSWMLATDHEKMKGNMTLLKKISLFTLYSSISIAWNNLTPFLKVGGEPLKYFMLSRHLPERDAIASTVSYNLIHLLATGISFILTSLILLLFFKLSNAVYIFVASMTFFIVTIVYCIYKMIRANIFFRAKKKHYRLLRKLSIGVRLSLKRLMKFLDEKRGIFFLSLFFDTIARFFEGLTFYYAFKLMKNPVLLISSALLDTGRTFLDTLFFFIPFQIGTREEGVHFFMEKILSISSQGFLSAVLLYRFVEIAWVFIGYCLWVISKRSFRDSRV
jgi:hypothetical protein